MFPVHRTPEEGHSARCLSKAMIAAIENYRDQVVDSTTVGAFADYEFRLWAQDNNALVWADSYLADGTCECICPLPLDEARRVLAAEDMVE